MWPFNRIKRRMTSEEYRLDQLESLMHDVNARTMRIDLRLNPCGDLEHEQDKHCQCKQNHSGLDAILIVLISLTIIFTALYMLKKWKPL